jgi:hypothetical protein
VTFVTSPPKESEPPKISKLKLTPQHYKIYRDKEYTDFFRQKFFCEKLIRVISEQFMIQAHIKNSAEEPLDEKVAYTIYLPISPAQAMLVHEKLDMLFTSCLKKKIIDKEMGKAKFR